MNQNEKSFSYPLICSRHAAFNCFYLNKLWLKKIGVVGWNIGVRAQRKKFAVLIKIYGMASGGFCYIFLIL